MKNPICMGKTINKIQRKFQYKWIRLQDGEEIIFYALFNTIVCINTNWQILDICTLRSYVHHRSCMFRLQIVPTLSQVTVILLTACIFVQMSWKVYPKTLSPSWIRLFEFGWPHSKFESLLYNNVTATMSIFCNTDLYYHIDNSTSKNKLLIIFWLYIVKLIMLHFKITSGVPIMK